MSEPPVVGFLRLCGWSEERIAEVVAAHERGEVYTATVTILAAAAPSPADQQKCECGAPADDISFDRSICACGSMHYYCAECGQQAEPCGEYTEEPSP